MNTYFRKTVMLSAFVLLAWMTSCSDYLDKSPLSDIDSNTAFKDSVNFQGFTEELYNCLPLMSSSEYHNNWNFGEEEYWNPSEQRLLAYHIDQGNYWAWNTVAYTFFKTAPGATATNVSSYTYSTTKTDKGRLWGLSWYGIRKANLGLANLDKLTGVSTETKNMIAGQLYFFRGFFHFTLMQYWGGLPYIGYVLPTSETPKLPRLKYQAIADSVALDFQKAASLLPVDWNTTAFGNPTFGNNEQRINKGMALSYLGKNYLWAGSPLMNNESTGSATYNKDYCKKAANAFAEVLKISDDTKYYELVPFTNYSQIFYTYNQSGKLPGKVTAADGHTYREAIMMENLAESASRWRWNQVMDYRPPVIRSSGIKCYPTANYVDYYGMANGLPIMDIATADAESGYDPTHPWKNRDPRFYKDIIYDGVKCIGNTPTNKADSTKVYASLFGDANGTSPTTGLYRQSASPGGNGQNAVFTGYMNMKFTSQYLNEKDGSAYTDNNCLVLCLVRLSDVYLMYAEAVAQGYESATASAPDYSLTAVGAINKVRDRAGVGHVASKFLGAGAEGLAAFMSEVRRERAVELAFEGHRFTDLRRWMLLTQSPYTLKKTVYFDRASDNNPKTDNPQDGHVLNIREAVLFQRNFSEKHYWFPFLQADVSMYKEFKQNPGW